MGDRIKKQRTVEEEFEFTMFGLPATLVVELETARGHTIRVPIGDCANFHSPEPYGYSQIHVPVRGKILRRITDAVDDAGLAGL